MRPINPPPRSSLPTPSPKSNSKLPCGIVALVVVLAGIVLPTLAVLAISLIAQLTGQSNPIASVLPGGGDNANTNAGTVSLPSLGAWKGTDRVNVLLLGIDSRPKEDPKTARTDTIILVTIDPSTKTGGMMSIPRDLYVPYPNPLPPRAPVAERINAAHLYGGPKYSMQTVAHNFGLKVDYYVRVNFNVVIELVDMLGGIDIYVEQEINDQLFPDMNYGYDPLIIKSGWQHMNGELALKYARTRHGNSDFSRMKRQQQVILALREKALSGNAILRLLPQTPAILQKLKDSVETNLSVTELMQLAMLAKDLPTDKISRVTVDETAVTSRRTPQGADVLVMNAERVNQLRQELYNPTLNAAANNKTPEPGRVAIQNGTQTSGLGQAAQRNLTNKGYTVARVENASQRQTKTTVVVYHDRSLFVKQLTDALGVQGVTVTTAIDNKNPLDALIILGDDYKP